MTGIILGQVQFVLVTALWGMLLMLGYDVLRFLRWVISHGKFVVVIEDILYWSVVSVPTYVVFFLYNEGEIRWYGALAVLLGGIFYEKGISWPIRRFGCHHFTIPKNRFMQFVSKQRKRFLHFCGRVCKNILRNGQKKKKGVEKKEAKNVAK